MATCLVFFSSMAVGQLTTATLSGEVQDNTGALVPKAHITAVNTDTGFTQSTDSNDQGAWRIDLLPVGGYRLTIKAEGFKTFAQSGIVLSLGQFATVNAALQIGDTSETISINSDVPLVNVTNSVVGATVQNSEIVNLPIVNRNVYDLLTLVPGVQTNTTSYTLGYPQQTVQINGGVMLGNAGSTSYYMDGGTNMTGLRNTGNTQPNPDAVNEFRVETNNYSAEYGRFPNGVINVITKSGTNAFHGSLFEFWRENALNALDRSFVASAPAAQPLHRHQFGGTVGGPIKRDKTFFFFSYGGLRQITTTPISNGAAVVPSAAQRAGNFSENLPSGPAASSCQSGTSTSFYVCNPKTNKPYAGNIIPASDLDATVQNILKGANGLPSIPLPNGAGNTYAGYIRNQNNTDEFLMKVDHQLTANQRLTGEVFETAGINSQNAGGNLPWSQQNYVWRQWNANISHVYTISPTLINQAWISFARNLGGRVNTPAHQISEYGSKFQVQGTPSLPQIAVSGYFTAGNAIAGPRAGSNYYEVRDTIIWTKGKHSLRFGGNAALDKDIQESLLNNYGIFNFTSAKSRSYNALSDFLLGLPNSMNQDAPSIQRMNSWYAGLFLMDDYRITSNLTFNLGLRWDVQTPPVDTDNKVENFKFGQQSTTISSAPLGLLVPGDKGVSRGIVPVRWNHFSPRVGFAWDVFGNSKIAVRGGAGIFWGSISGNEWGAAGQPFSFRASFTNVKSITDPYANVAGGSPFPYNYTPSAPRFTAPFSAPGTDPNFDWTSAYQANLTVEQQWTSTFATSVGYVGAMGRHLPYTTDVNYPMLVNVGAAAPSTSNVDQRRPYQPNPPLSTGTATNYQGIPITYQGINIFGSNQTSAYHAMQVTANKRMSQHFTVRSFYVWAKNWASLGMQNSTASVVNQTKLWLERGRSDNDYRHMFTTSVVWMLDYYNGNNRYIKTAANGWQVSPIIRFRSGAPFTVTNGTDTNLDGTNNDRPNIVGNPYLEAHRSRNDVINAWFNTAAFVAPTTATEGTTGRNTLDGPGSKSVDVAFFRNFALWEKSTLQFRGEFTNVLNNVNLSNPNATLNSPNYGKITGANSMRQTQLGLRLTF
ncbi:TonB-dependent receptor [Terriglobus albidus]|nr:TonB-dependent receptor [Terriglobus albidus]